MIRAIATHTPGPWIADIEAARGNWAGAFSIEVDGFVICGRAGVPSRESESAANARMIAAAPDLLAALKQIEAEMSVSLGSSYGETREQVRRAIAKAEGR